MIPVQEALLHLRQVGAAARVDVEHLPQERGLTAIDDCTRLRVLRLYPAADQKTAIQFLDYVLARLPFPVEVIQTDNGAEFGASFHWHALDKGIQHVYIKPATPRLNGKVERSHHIDAEEFYRLLDGVVIDDANLFKRQAPRVGGLLQLPPTARRPRRPNPYERLRQKTNTQV